MPWRIQVKGLMSCFSEIVMQNNSQTEEKILLALVFL